MNVMKVYAIQARHTLPSNEVGKVRHAQSMSVVFVRYSIVALRFMLFFFTPLIECLFDLRYDYTYIGKIFMKRNNSMRYIKFVSFIEHA